MTRVLTKENTMKEMSLLAAVKDYFGFKPGQTMSEFMAEYKELDEGDKNFFRREFVKVGYKAN